LSWGTSISLDITQRNALTETGIIYFTNKKHFLEKARSWYRMLYVSIISFICLTSPNTSLIPELMDYPDSDEDGGTQAVVNPNILNTEDAEAAEERTARTGIPGAGPTVVSGDCAEDGTQGRRMLQASSSAQHRMSGSKRSYSSQYDGGSGGDGPDLPPIYLTVRKEREKKLVTRHFNGGGVAGAESTAYGASVSQIETVGSFANAGDRRHNFTQLKHDCKHLRNISTSFDTGTLKCTTCTGGHTVLHREIEGEDVGQDCPPVFVLSDQNFPAMLPVGGGG
jgi:hypothetical protein